jgi:hypothetical protein
VEITDELICAYWDAIAADPVQRDLRICATVGASAELVMGARDSAIHHGADVDTADEACAANPATPPSLLRAWIDTKHVSAVLTNPAVGPWLPWLIDEVDRHRGDLLCTNVGADACDLVAQLDAHPAGVLANPRCPAEIALAHLDEHPSAWSHPAVCGPKLAEMLAQPDPHVDELGPGRGPGLTLLARRNAAARNPNCPLDELARLANPPGQPSSAAPAGSNARTHGLRGHLQQRLWQTDARRQPALHLRLQPLDAGVAADIVALDDTAATTARLLLDTAFDGTVAELLAVAGAVTRPAA